MALAPRAHTIPVGSPITANGTVVDGLQNLGCGSSGTVIILVTSSAGNGPLVLNLYAGTDGTNYALVGSTASIVAAGTYRVVFHDVLEPLLRVTSTASGSTTVSNLQLLMPSPAA